MSHIISIGRDLIRGHSTKICDLRGLIERGASETFTATSPFHELQRKNAAKICFNTKAFMQTHKIFVTRFHIKRNVLNHKKHLPY